MSAYPVLSDICLERLLGIRRTRAAIARPEGSILFAEGQKAFGVHVVWDGNVKLSIGAADGKSLIIGIVGRRTVIGLQSSISGLPYAASAEVVTAAKLSFLSRDELLRHLRTADGAAFAAAEIVSAIYCSVLAEIKTVAYSNRRNKEWPASFWAYIQCLRTPTDTPRSSWR
jgi:CRP-like cAMP-binding protein